MSGSRNMRIYRFNAVKHLVLYDLKVQTLMYKCSTREQLEISSYPAQTKVPTQLCACKIAKIC